MPSSTESCSTLLSKQALADRLREVRLECFGDDAGLDLASSLAIPPRTWLNYEDGVTIPGEILLAFLVLTGTDPVWLLRGQGSRFRSAAQPAVVTLALNRVDDCDSPASALIEPDLDNL